MYREQLRQTDDITLKGSSFATYQGSEAPATNQATSQPASQPINQPTNQPSDQPKNQRSYKCPAGCSDDHRFKDCPVVNSQKGQPTEDQQPTFKAAIKDSPNKAKALARVVKRLPTATKWVKELLEDTKQQTNEPTGPIGAFTSQTGHTDHGQRTQPTGSIGSNQATGPVDNPHLVNTTALDLASEAAIQTMDHHPLRYSYIYGSGSDIHISNELSRFEPSTIKWVEPSEQLWCGESRLPILAYGTATIKIRRLDTGTTTIFKLYGCAYIPSFATNVVSARKLRLVDICWSTKGNYLEYKGTPYIQLYEHYNQCLLEYTTSP